MDVILNGCGEKYEGTDPNADNAKYQKQFKKFDDNTIFSDFGPGIVTYFYFLR